MKCVVAAILPVAALSTAVMAAGPISYPQTERGAVRETQFGEVVEDLYRWLENDVRVDPKVRAWVTAENAVTNSYLDTLPGRSAIKARLSQLWNYERFGIPEKAGSNYFYTRNTGLQNQSVLFVRAGLTGAPRQLIDPNGWARDGATALAEWVPSKDGTRLAYTVQDGGTDWRTIRVLDVATDQPLPDEVKWAKYTSISWAHDGSGFYYGRFAEPAQAQAFQAGVENQTIYFHRIGTPQSADRPIFATPDRPSLLHFAEVSDDGAWLVISSSDGGNNNDVTLIDLRAATPQPARLVSGLNSSWVLVGGIGDRLWFITDKDAPLHRIVEVDAAHPATAARTIVAQGASTIDGASLIGGKLIVSYLVDAKTEVRRFALDGAEAGRVALPGIGTASGFHGEVGDPETFFSFASFNQPTVIYRYDAASGQVSVFARPQVAFDPQDYSVEQRFYASKDGTRVPMFVVHKRGLDLSAGAPTLLYAYGGFNVAQQPGFNPANLAWMEMGGVYVVANIRGGSEYGQAWHNGGRRANKQNVFDDFIAAAEYLIAEGITTKDKLVIQGRSNGGLLVGAVVNQRPDLFAAALPQVGVMDMLRFNRFTAGRYWVDDYGDPAVEADFRVLRRYSPYHNIRAGQRYPAIMVTTADTDDRVVPGHSFKYAAALQAADIGDRPHLIRIETRAGHGSGKPTDKLIEEYADMWAFAARWTGLAVPDATSPPR